MKLLKKALSVVVAATMFCTILVPVSFAEDVVELSATTTAITGNVRAADITGQVSDDFDSAIPVGAVVTAIPNNEDAMGNYTNTADGFTVETAIVQPDGSFTLELDAGVSYTVIISHIKYAILGGDMYISNTALIDGVSYFADVTLTEGEVKDLGNGENLVLNYTFFGDLNRDGALTSISGDYGTFMDSFGSSVNAD